jgi:hypothetical protein
MAVLLSLHHHHQELCRVRFLRPAPPNPKVVLVFPSLFCSSRVPSVGTGLITVTSLRLICIVFIVTNRCLVKVLPKYLEMDAFLTKEKLWNLVNAAVTFSTVLCLIFALCCCFFQSFFVNNIGYWHWCLHCTLIVWSSIYCCLLENTSYCFIIKCFCYISLQFIYSLYIYNHILHLFRLTHFNPSSNVYRALRSTRNIRTTLQWNLNCSDVTF